MKVFKFGGASVKDHHGVINLFNIVKLLKLKKTVIVISAMGKTTNAFEKVVNAYFNDLDQINFFIDEIKKMHFNLIRKLFKDINEELEINIDKIFSELNSFILSNKNMNYSYVYDQIVSNGELLSTLIIHHYLKENGLENTWLDSRICIKTDSYFRDSNLDWMETEKKINSSVDKNLITITQGFIGSDSNNNTTTLGREGSDYSAAIFAYALNAKSVTIWKDVPGVLNGDPRIFDDFILLNKISYREAIELAFYGASVIHPKTLQPLQRKEIPLFVKSFEEPLKDGTSVSKGISIDPNVPCFILKSNQVLLKMSSKDFSFIVEDNISEIFSLLHKYQMKVELIQNSAISFSVCVNNKYNRLDELISVLKLKYKVKVYNNVELYTIRHFDIDSIKLLDKFKGKKILEQRTEKIFQVVKAQ
ncbi:MAG: aspartate kinase [Flavobacteriaceae bacterium]|nr:aspartate kinase [Flavobacteriaceae bacterium]|tara:strand:+ start:1362 stop:2618 length:1257 start_codon:yes stop_codon:yes gene_type:complete